MKNKGKKIIKGIAVGAVACLSVGLLAGCEMSEADITKYDQEIEAGKELLQTQIDELKKQNDALTSQNAKLEEQNQILKDESLKMTKEQVFDMLKIAQAKLQLNENGIRDNVRMKMQSEDLQQTASILKTQDNGYVVVNEISDTTYGVVTNRVVCHYEDEKTHYYYGKTEKESVTETRKFIENNNIEFMNIQTLAGAFTYCRSAEDIKSVEITPEGNYKILLSIESKEETESESHYNIDYIEYILTGSGEILSCKVKTLTADQYDEEEYFEITEWLVTYEYNVVDVEFVNEILEEAKSAEITETH